MEDAQAAGGPMTDIAVAKAVGDAIKDYIIKNKGEGRLVIITVDPEDMEATAETLALLRITNRP